MLTIKQVRILKKCSFPNELVILSEVHVLLVPGVGLGSRSVLVH